MAMELFHGCGHGCYIPLSSTSILKDPEWILRPIASGGNGSVWRATHRDKPCDHAVKTFHESGNWEVSILRNLMECRTTHVSRALYAGPTSNTSLCGAKCVSRLAIVFELLDVDLYRALIDPQLCPGMVSLSFGIDAIRQISHQIFQALADVHASGVIHGDLKPDNIMFVSKDSLHIKLSDFGNSTLVTEQWRSGGTPQYLAPENVVGRHNYGVKSDVFSAGLVILELFCRLHWYHAPLLPADLVEVYYEECNQTTDGNTERYKLATLYHLVLLSCLMQHRVVWVGNIVRMYYGKLTKGKTLQQLSCFLGLTEQIRQPVIRMRFVKFYHPAFFSFLVHLFRPIHLRPTAEEVLKHPWFQN